MKKPDARDVRTFRNIVKAHYRKNGRSLPWRKTRDPYRILVSEVMLQQTQVERVIPKYAAFFKQFPTVASLAEAPLGDVLRAWSGLGYNRRAKMLHGCAKAVVKGKRGVFPKIEEELEALPGIGPYTAGAVMAFAYNKPVVMIETNIRTAYLYHFFPGESAVSDRELMPLIAATLDAKEPRLWYSALMDYGTWIKKTYGNHGARSKHHTKQSAFKGSAREVRGAIIRALTKESATLASLTKSTGLPHEAVEVQVAALLREGLIQKAGARLRLP